MTAKRFIQVIDGVKDTRTGRVLTHPLEITLKLNEINDLYDYVFNRNEGLEKENEQLKKQMQRLYNYFVDWHGDIMGANQFSEMWDNVKEDKKWEKSGMNDCETIYNKWILYL